MLENDVTVNWQYRKAGTFHVEGEKEPRSYNPHVVQQFVDDQGRRATAFVCECSSTTLNNEANAKRIAALPQLLAAAIATLAEIDAFNNDETTIAADGEALRAAITEAQEANHA